jgi:flagellar hook assembly protein FlgD
LGQEVKADQSILAIENLLIYPSPASVVATFCYELGSYADEVTITIYTISGRKVKSITGASARKGYNEEMWDTRNDDGNKVANGTYFYKMTVEKDNKKIQKIGKLSIVR